MRILAIACFCIGAFFLALGSLPAFATVWTSLLDVLIRCLLAMLMLFQVVEDAVGFGGAILILTGAGIGFLLIALRCSPAPESEEAKDA